jgi:rhamnulokinase
MAHYQRYIGFDLGAESGRSIVGTINNGKLTLKETHRFFTPMIECRGHIYWDILGIYQELEQGFRKTRELFGTGYDGISIDTWGVDYVLLDSDDRLLGYPYHYRDIRTDNIMDEAFTRLPKEQIYRYTGTAFMQLNTLYQLLAETRQQLNFCSVAGHFLTIPDYLLYLLSGEKKVEFTIASTTQLTDPYKRDWCRPLMDAFELPSRIFPDIVEAGTYLATLDNAIANKTGMSPEIPVIAGASHDTAAAVAAVPALENNWAYLSSGTWSLMGMELKKPLITNESLEANFANEGGVAGNIRFLKNIIGLWPIQECRRYWQQIGTAYSYQQLEQMALEVGPVNAWLNLNDERFFKPGNMPEKVIAFLKETKQKFREEPGWICRCILESLAYKYRETIRLMESVTGEKIEVLHLVGGGTQNKLLSQLTADVTGKEITAGPVECTIAGNIGMQAICTGILKDLNELREMIARSFALEKFQPKDQGYWDKNEKQYQDLCREHGA